MTVHAEAVSPIRARVMRGLAWKAASSTVLQVVRFIVAVILAHLLSPHDYGLAGMVLVFSSLVLLFSDLSFGVALVYRPELSEADRSTVFWMSSAAGLVFTLVGLALSGPIADFYGVPEVKPLFEVLSISFLVTSIASTQTALLTRDMNFRALELRQIVSALVSAVVGIGLAIRGFGPWAIVGQQVTVAFASTMLLWVSSAWRPRFMFSVQSLRSLAGYSGNVFGARLLFYVTRNADNILVGRFLGPASLGAYSVAYNVILMPFSQIALPVQEVLFPAFSRMQDDVKRLAAAWLRANRLVGAVTIPALAGLMVVAPDFVQVALGERWQAATPVIQILAWVGLLQSLQGLNGSVLRARDRTKTLLDYSIVVMVSSLASFVIGLHWGIVGVATCFAISSTFIEPYYTWLTARAVDISVWEFLRALRGVLQATLVMVVCVVVLRHVAAGEGLRVLPRLVLTVAAGMVVYLGWCFWRAAELVSEVRELLRGRVPKRAARTPAGPSGT